MAANYYAEDLVSLSGDDGIHLYHSAFASEPTAANVQTVTNNITSPFNNLGTVQWPQANMVTVQGSHSHLLYIQITQKDLGDYFKDNSTPVYLDYDNLTELKIACGADTTYRNILNMPTKDDAIRVVEKMGWYTWPRRSCWAMRDSASTVPGSSYSCLHLGGFQWF